VVGLSVPALLEHDGLTIFVGSCQQLQRPIPADPRPMWQLVELTSCRLASPHKP
jgi:hypothetical protein